MTSSHSTADRQAAPFLTPGMAVAILFKAAGLGRWLRTRRELRRQRRAIRQLRGLDNRTLHDMGFARAEIASVVTHGREGR